MSEDTDLSKRILDCALSLAEQRSWEAVRLHDVATALAITLDQIRPYYAEKEDLVEAWFDRADHAMLEATASPEFLRLSSRQRLHWALMSWLDALASHRQVTRQMIRGKLEPGHLHIQVPALMRISRTVQWMREAAHRDATYGRRALEETGLTGIYLLTFLRWMRDRSAGFTDTRRFLDRMLRRFEDLSRFSCGHAAKDERLRETAAPPLRTAAAANSEVAKPKSEGLS